MKGDEAPAPDHSGAMVVPPLGARLIRSDLRSKKTTKACRRSQTDCLGGASTGASPESPPRRVVRRGRVEGWAWPLRSAFGRIQDIKTNPALFVVRFSGIHKGVAKEVVFAEPFGSRVTFVGAMPPRASRCAWGPFFWAGQESLDRKSGRSLVLALDSSRRRWSR